MPFDIPPKDRREQRPTHPYRLMLEAKLRRRLTDREWQLAASEIQRLAREDIKNGVFDANP